MQCSKVLVCFTGSSKECKIIDLLGTIKVAKRMSHLITCISIGSIDESCRAAKMMHFSGPAKFRKLHILHQEDGKSQAPEVLKWP